MSFPDNTTRTGNTQYPMPVKNHVRTFNNILQIKTGQRDDYTTDCLLFYPYFNDYYKIIAIELSKQQSLNADRK